MLEAHGRWKLKVWDKIEFVVVFFAVALEILCYLMHTSTAPASEHFSASQGTSLVTVENLSDTWWTGFSRESHVNSTVCCGEYGINIHCKFHSACVIQLFKLVILSEVMGAQDTRLLIAINNKQQPTTLWPWP